MYAGEELRDGRTFRRARGVDAVEFGEAEVGCHPIRRHVPVPGAHALARGERLLQSFPALPQLDFAAPPPRDVAEQDRHLARIRRSDAERLHVEPAAQRLRAVVEPGGLARKRHPAVSLGPIGLQAGRQLAGQPPRWGGETTLAFEGGIGLQETVVDPHALLQDDLDQAEAGVYAVEHLPIACRIGALCGARRRTDRRAAGVEVGLDGQTLLRKTRRFQRRPGAIPCLSVSKAHGRHKVSSSAGRLTPSGASAGAAGRRPHARCKNVKQSSFE